jgi:hypothetical protein
MRERDEADAREQAERRRENLLSGLKEREAEARKRANEGASAAKAATTEPDVTEGSPPAEPSQSTTEVPHG